MSTETKHTKGPWRASGGSLTVPKCHVMSGNGKDSYALAHVFGESDTERMANARLIAAAPELLEALKGTVAELERMHEHYLKACRGGCPTLACVEYAEAAIAKAEGRQ
jgi:hypothetical protein